MKIRNIVAVCGIVVGSVFMSTACSNNAKNKEIGSSEADSSKSAESVDY